MRFPVLNICAFRGSLKSLGTICVWLNFAKGRLERLSLLPALLEFFSLTIHWKGSPLLAARALGQSPLTFHISQTIPPAVRESVEGGSNLITDALSPYKDLDAEYVHEVIDHAEAYVHGHVHTNGIENFWSLLKRAIKGTYVNIEPFHLTRYLDEETFRFNTRKTDDADRFQNVVSGITGKWLTYNQLIGGTTQI